MGDLGCGQKCVKFLLFIVNLIFFLLGLAAMVLGIWALVDKNKMNVLTKIGAAESNFNVTGLLESSAIVFLVGGVVIMIIGFLGCFGACKLCKWALCVYAFLMIIVLLIQIATIVVAVLFQNQVKDEMKDFLKKNINETYEGKLATAEEFSLGLDYAQVYFQCCGIDSYEEFAYASKWNKTINENVSYAIPPTCCKLKDPKQFYDSPEKAELKEITCPIAPTEDNSNRDKPCWDSIKKYVEQRIYIIIGVAAGIILLELLCLIFACCLISAIRKSVD